MLASTMQPNLDQLSGLDDVRNAALARWQANGWPDAKAESWRFTRLGAVVARELAPAIGMSETAHAPGAEITAIATEMKAHVIRFYNGMLDVRSLDGLPDGMTATHSLNTDFEAITAEVAGLAPVDHPVGNLSLAAMSAGLRLSVDAGVHIEQPVLLAFEGTGETISAHPVVMVDVGISGAAVIAEWHQSQLGLSAPLVALRLGDKARLDYAKVQAEGANNVHLAATGISLGEGSVFAGFSISVGGQLARLETHVTLTGESAECGLSAIYLGRDKQHHDITTYMDHAVGHCHSSQIIRGVLDDASRGVFQGKVHVAPDAQKTDGQQMSRALLLSRKAEADAKPELEIYADDVICAHGATVGELDETQLFYLTSRGIPKATARAMLIGAFLDDAIDSVENAALAGMLRHISDGWMADVKGVSL
ncbi:MAG: Fe-S cluster assembly protein SufD [Candidatus Puniceispirillum sp.]|uniref:Fe-S cluster assembly protein SufD n=1 Tax=Candidatus Puniceispirillum sp. TaxID=2026719 RepID=UPI001ED10EC1|nr:Fe-S cluster assembly protein SufD [Candidatus Puniceispirillum sp.]MBT6416060.1 Fe-S cluster assembly protein SufD [Candidatus Puniceispirillum sp.]MBT6566243.1 Fe-S cluster assembly protein SufD [Candidatus Puniceispirillum sp.]